VELARAVLAATAGDEELAEARDLLARVVDQDIDETPADGGGPAIRQGVAPDRVCSVVDPEMRHGRKSSSRRVDGYKAHVLTDHGTELVLGVTVTPANDPDGPEAAGLVAQADAGVPVREVLGDTAFGDGDTREAVEAAGATVTAKDAAPGHHWSLHQERLRDRPRGPVGDLPGRHTTTTTGIGQDHKGRRVTVLKFADDLCRDCPLRAACTIAAHGRWVTLNFHEARLQAARADQARPTVKRKLRRRAIVERKLAEGKRHGMGKARYRGTRKVLLQQRLTAATLNVKRLFTIDPALGGHIGA
jgi:hypothetical protein